MSSDDSTPGERSADEGRDVRDRLERQADRAVDSFDEGFVDLLSRVLDTDTRARLYIYLRQHPWSTSEEVAAGTGLYPSTVREALAQLHAEGKVDREKRESDGAGNNPYEYRAMAPSDLVSEIVDDVQSELNAVFNLDRLLSGDLSRSDQAHGDPVTIKVEEASGEGDEPDRDSD